MTTDFDRFEPSTAIAFESGKQNVANFFYTLDGQDLKLTVDANGFASLAVRKLHLSLGLARTNRATKDIKSAQDSWENVLSLIPIDLTTDDATKLALDTTGSAKRRQLLTDVIAAIKPADYSTKFGSFEDFLCLLQYFVDLRGSTVEILIPPVQRQYDVRSSYPQDPYLREYQNDLLALRHLYLWFQPLGGMPTSDAGRFSYKAERILFEPTTEAMSGHQRMDRVKAWYRFYRKSGDHLGLKEHHITSAMKKIAE